MSMSGQRHGMKEAGEISKDIYRYYGVSKEDIEKKTKRYNTVVAGLVRVY